MYFHSFGCGSTRLYRLNLMYMVTSDAAWCWYHDEKWDLLQLVSERKNDILNEWNTAHAWLLRYQREHTESNTGHQYLLLKSLLRIMRRDQLVGAGLGTGATLTAGVTLLAGVLSRVFGFEFTRSIFCLLSSSTAVVSNSCSLTASRASRASPNAFMMSTTASCLFDLFAYVFPLYFTE